MSDTPRPLSETTTASKFRKKPVVIDAFQWTAEPVKAWRDLDAWLVSLGLPTMDEADGSDAGDVPMWVNGDEYGGRHVCRQLVGHDGECTPNMNAASALGTRAAVSSDASGAPTTCGKIAASWIPRLGMSFACALPLNHEGACRAGGTCFTHGDYVAQSPLTNPVCPHCLTGSTPTEDSAGSLSSGEPHKSSETDP